MLGRSVDLGTARLAVPKRAEALWSGSRCVRRRADAVECPTGVMQEGFLASRTWASHNAGVKL
mgnify:CR=1 FL=1